jgi:hypothetical protein
VLDSSGSSDGERRMAVAGPDPSGVRQFAKTTFAGK